MTRSTGPKTPPPGGVRIIGGRWRGTRLLVADAPGLRPTSDRARETLFNWLQPVLPGARVLDLFAGSGALGMEALSRGAAEALLVERDPRLVASLAATIQRLHAESQAQAIRADALDFLRTPLHGRFDVVFLDPPFADQTWMPVLAALAPWLSDGAWLYLEAPAGPGISPGGGWRLYREGHTRDVRHTLYQRIGA
ncbi:MAG: 16S rRNA (guanine(966)-N(2))-methyltransferase RsmD [Luteimonas sp.]